jgi:catecholate siderophore receptor
VNACNYVLSGKRHAAGLEFDAAGRISQHWELYFSYAFIPQAKVDESSGAQGTEPVGSRPGLTPRHSASLWSTYKVASDLRLGGGLNYRSSDRPVGLAATSPIEAPGFTTADAMAEYTNGNWVYKLNAINITDRHYADLLYRGHYVPGKSRTIQLSVSYNF